MTRPKTRAKALVSLTKDRAVFTATFDRYGTKPGYRGPERTMLLCSITTEDGRVVADHLWFNLTKAFAVLGELTEGDRVEFHARAKPYIKGYVNAREFIDERQDDYKLAWPTKARKLARPPA